MASWQSHLGDPYGARRDAAPDHRNAEWIAFCPDKDRPCMPVLTLEEVFDEAHVQSVDLLWVATHPHGGDDRLVRPPVTFSAAPFELRHAAPLLDEHGTAMAPALASGRWLGGGSEPSGPAGRGAPHPFGNAR